MFGDKDVTVYFGLVYNDIGNLLWRLFILKYDDYFRYTNVLSNDVPLHCTAPVMWGNVRPWPTMLGSNVLLWFEACIFMILTLDGKIFREKVR